MFDLSLCGDSEEAYDLTALSSQLETQSPIQTPVVSEEVAGGREQMTNDYEVGDCTLSVEHTLVRIEKAKMELGLITEVIGAELLERVKALELAFKVSCIDHAHDGCPYKFLRNKPECEKCPPFDCYSKCWEEYYLNIAKGGLADVDTNK